MTKQSLVIRKSAPRPITADDRQRYLDLLASGLSESAAAASLRPTSLALRPGRASFEALKSRDPEFRQQIEDAKQIFAATVMEAIVQRGIIGELEPLSYKGKLTGDVIRKKSDTVLLRIAQAIMPQFANQSVHRHEGQIDVVHNHNSANIDLSKIYALSAEQQRQLANILPLLAPDTEENIVDSSFVEVTESDEDLYKIPPEGF